jgi:hypothetical protein
MCHHANLTVNSKNAARATPAAIASETVIVRSYVFTVKTLYGLLALVSTNHGFNHPRLATTMIAMLIADITAKTQ